MRFSPPAFALIGFGRIRIFVPLEPKPEPVDGALLRGVTHGGVGEDVLIGVEQDQVDGLCRAAAAN